MKALLASVILIVALLVAAPAWASPTTTGISPDIGPAAGGTEVTITGSDLDQVTSIRLMNTTPTIKSQTATTLTFVTKPMDGAYGPCGDVELYIGNIQEDTRQEFCATPSITSISPAAGPLAGGTTVTVKGVGFYPINPEKILFGGVEGDVQSLTDSTIIAEVPPGTSLGPVDVSVKTNIGTEIFVAGFTYVGEPTITSVSPENGPETGGNTVTVEGTNFTGATKVEFDGTAGTDLTVVSDTEITVKPSAGSGTVDVKVVGAAGEITAPSAYTYVAAPTATALNPASGPAAGGTAVTIAGTNFVVGGTTVTIGGNTVPSGSVTVNSSTSLTFSTPAHAAGNVSVSVTTPGGTTSDITGGFTYAAAPAITAISPSTGPLAGGTVVTITGSGFTGTTAVRFGASAASSVVVNSDSSISATSPSGTGRVDITITAPGGTSATSAADVFTYSDPAGTITIRQVTKGGDGTFTFASATSELNLSIATSGGVGESGPVTLPAGDYTVVATQSGGFGLTSITCSSGGVGDLAGATASISLSSGEAVTCTFTSYGSATASTELIQDFFAAQGAVILANLPDGQRRIDRLQGVVPLPGDPVPALMGYMADGGNAALQLPTVSGSLAQIDAITGKPQSPFDLWFQATLGSYQSDDLSGRFGIVSLGADYLVSKDMLVGAFLQADVEPDATDGSGGAISGKGWLAGPYATVRLGEGLYLDLLGGAGQSANTISPDGTYTDSFDASRWLASASLSGQIRLGDWTISPTASLSYFQSTSEGYIDGLGVDIPSVTGGLGQLTLGPNLGHSFALDDGTAINTTLGLAGVVDLSVDDDEITTEVHGRLKAGVSVATPGGASFGISGGFDGLGGGTAVQSVSGSLNASVPID